VIQDEECCEVSENLVTSSSENHSVLVASKLILILTKRIVTSDDIVYVKKKILQNERDANQPRYRQYGPCQYQAQVRSASHVGNLNSDVNLKHSTS